MERDISCDAIEITNIVKHLYDQTIQVWIDENKPMFKYVNIPYESQQQILSFVRGWYWAKYGNKIAVVLH